MTATSQGPNHRTLPRKKRTPSARDQAIFIAYRANGRTQEDLAREHNLSQSRISQIIRRVEHWQQQRSPADSDAHAQRLQLDRQLARERLQATYDRALRSFDQAPTEIKTVRQQTIIRNPQSEIRNSVGVAVVCAIDHDEPADSIRNPQSEIRNSAGPSTIIKEEIRRQVLPPAQLLRTALRAATELARAAEKMPPAPSAQSDEEDDWERQGIMHHTLCQLRQEAEDQGRVAKSRDHVVTVDQWFAALIGDRPHWINPDDVAAGTPLHELSRFYYPSSQTLENHADTDLSTASNPSISSATDADRLAVDESSSHPQSAICNPQLDVTWDEPSPAADNSPTTHPTFLTNPQSQIPNPKSPSDPQSATRNSERRRLAHEARLDQWRDAVRRGIPYHFVFDPADGPLPEPDSRPPDYGYQPTPPPTADESRQMVTDYLASIRAEQAAITRNWNSS